MNSLVELIVLPDFSRLQVESGSLLHAVLMQAGYPLRTPCGGNGTCGKCLVRFADIRSTDDESIIVSFEQRHNQDKQTPISWDVWKTRLSFVSGHACQTVVRQPMIVWLPEESLHQASHQIVTSHVAGHVHGVGAGGEIDDDSVLQTTPLQMTPPTRNDAVSDVERFQNVFALSSDGQASGKPLELSLAQLQELPEQLRNANWRGNVVSAFDRLIAFQSDGDAEKSPVKYAVAVDIGTTTLAAELLDLDQKTSCGVVSRHNPQAAHGDDIISRIQFASESPEKLERLHRLIVDAINNMISELTQKGTIRREQIAVVSIAGNTVMQQLFCKINPKFLGLSPFVPATTESLIFRASEHGLAMNQNGLVLTFPIIGGFVGGDLVAGLIATEIRVTAGPSLLIDIGTNGEMILWHRKIARLTKDCPQETSAVTVMERLPRFNRSVTPAAPADCPNCYETGNGQCLAAATAAGPAFEGARIQHGMIAAPGAVERVEIGTSLQIRTIGNKPPVGICGSGLIDLVAELIRIGAVTSAGQMLAGDNLPETVPAPLRSRFVAEGRQSSFLLVPAGESGTGNDILLTQRDIRQVQLAAGAVRAGITLLLKKAGVRQKELETVWLAGGFGNYVRPKNAQQIGLLPPDIPTERIQFCGNTSLAGAKAVLLSQLCYREMQGLTGISEHVDLSAFPDFSVVFSESMQFPQKRVRDQ